MTVGKALQPGLPNFCMVEVPHLFCILFCQVLRYHIENVKPGREAVIVHLLHPLLQCTLDGACSFSCAFCHDFRPLAYRSASIVALQIRLLIPGGVSPLDPFSLKRTVFSLRQQCLPFAGL